jgi:hypothetical protein
VQDLFQQLDEIVRTTISSFQLTDVVFVVIGILLLIFGRRLYWLALAGLGFAIAVHLSREYLLFQSTQQQVIVGVVLGLVGGLLAVVAQQLAVRVAGFILGGWGTFFVARTLWPDADLMIPILLAAGGAILGVLFAAKLFDVALVLVTSCVGAVLISQHLYLDPAIQTIVWLILTLFGIALQFGRGKSRRRKRLSKDED